MWKLIKRAVEGNLQEGTVFTAPTCPIRLEIQYADGGFIYYYIEFCPELIGKYFDLRKCNIHEFMEI